MPRSIPSISAKFICIVDHQSISLAALISTYIAQYNHYPLVFEFPTVTAAKRERKDDLIDEHLLSHTRAEEAAVYIHNMMVRCGKVENVIVAGLSKEQKSYVKVHHSFNRIDIDTIQDVDFALSPFFEEKSRIKCRLDDCINGLYAALQANCTLQYSEDAPDIELKYAGREALVVIEQQPFVSSVIAVNYAFAIGGDVAYVDKIEDEDQQDLIFKFSLFGQGNKEAGAAIKLFVQERLRHISFDKATYVTYFTKGVPYAFGTGNRLPSTSIPIHLHPDLFIANNLLLQDSPIYGGAIVFSPEFFEDEETKQVSTSLQKERYFVKELTGKNADVFNFSHNITLFPYDLLHICSHGGEVDGHEVEVSFRDRDGNAHTVVYESVLSISPSLRKGKLTVGEKQYWRKFDGLVWRSPELKAKKIPHYVFADMQNALSKTLAKDKKVGPKIKVSNSNAIQCSDGPFIGLSQSLAAYGAPIIFNNTCWSWLYAAEPFLTSGARAYIGTFWNVSNDAALAFAQSVYSLGFHQPLMDAIHASLKLIEGTSSENIYVIWGMPFTRLGHCKNADLSRANVYRELVLSSGRWQDRMEKTSNERTKEDIMDNVKWLTLEQLTNFTKKDREVLAREMAEMKARRAEKEKDTSD